MAQEKKSSEGEATAAQVSAPVEATPKTAKTKSAPVENSVTLVLTGAGSYRDLGTNLGPFRKGSSFTVDAEKAGALLKTGMFEKV